MGRRDRERKERIRSGEEKPLSEQRVEEARQILGNPVMRGLARLRARSGVMSELKKGTTSEQVGRLDVLVDTGALPASRLKKALMDNAPKEMDKAIRKYQKQGREITVDSLLAEARSTSGFADMIKSAGLSMEWFEDLARERMEAHGL